MPPNHAALALPCPSPLASFEAKVERAQEYAAGARASSTRTKYARDFEAFEGWCRAEGLEALPALPATIAVYLSELATEGLRPATLDRKLVAIGHAHRTAGFAWKRGEVVRSVRAGIRREHGIAPEQKAPVDDDELRRIVSALDASLQGLRDRALLTMGWFGAFRRAELVSLEVRDVARSREGLIVRLRRSKMDQDGGGASKGIPFAMNPALCPVRALDAWLAAAGIAAGALFRAVDTQGHVSGDALSDRSVARIVQRKRRARRARSLAPRGPLAPRRLRDDRREEGQEPRRDHAADPPPLRARRAIVHPARRALQRQRRHGHRVTTSPSRASRRRDRSRSLMLLNATCSELVEAHGLRLDDPKACALVNGWYDAARALRGYMAVAEPQGEELDLVDVSILAEMFVRATR